MCDSTLLRCSNINTEARNRRSRGMARGGRRGHRDSCECLPYNLNSLFFMTVGEESARLAPASADQRAVGTLFELYSCVTSLSVRFGGFFW
jgi:hypothetical protein